MNQNALNLIKIFERFEELERQNEKLKKDLLPVLRKIKDSEIQELLEKHPYWKKWIN